MGCLLDDLLCVVLFWFGDFVFCFYFTVVIGLVFTGGLLGLLCFYLVRGSGFVVCVFLCGFSAVAFVGFFDDYF